MKREEALELLHQYVSNPRMLAHCLASEAVMRGLARHFGEDEEAWGLAGLLHDLDVEMTASSPEIHGLETAKILTKKGLQDDIVDAIRMHNEMATGMERSTLFQHALAAGETITGLITATALVYPDKKLSSVKPASVVKRMKEKAFAASVNREHILECERIGLPLVDFAHLAVKAMQEMEDQDL